MAVERTLQVGTLVTDLLQVLLGPLVFWFVLLHFGKPLKQFVSNLGEFTFKAAGVEASAKKRR